VKTIENMTLSKGSSTSYSSLMNLVYLLLNFLNFSILD